MQSVRERVTLARVSSAQSVALAEQARDTYLEVGEAARDELVEVEAFLHEHQGARR
jgi:hypothetical protein